MEYNGPKKSMLQSINDYWFIIIIFLGVIIYGIYHQNFFLSIVAIFFFLPFLSLITIGLQLNISLSERSIAYKQYFGKWMVSETNIEFSEIKEVKEIPSRGEKHIEVVSSKGNIISYNLSLIKNGNKLFEILKKKENEFKKYNV